MTVQPSACSADCGLARRLADQAGALLREGLSRQHQVVLKSPFELVTEMDRASEQLIIAAIRADGLTASDVARRFQLALSTAKRYVQRAKK